MNPENAKSWGDMLSGPTGGWVACVVLGVVLGSVIVWLARRYESFRNNSEALFHQLIKDQTELLTQTKVQSDRVIELMSKVSIELDQSRREDSSSRTRR